MRVSGLLLLLAFLAPCGVACRPPDKGVVVASASGESGYAERYPAALGKLRGELIQHETETRTLLPKFSNYPTELDKTDWATVRAVYEAANSAGSSGAYASRARENRAVETFFSDEKAELSKRVAGAANYAAQQKGCKAEVYGPAAHALEKGVEKQLEERLRARNEGHQLIESNAEQLGKPNLNKLRTQADELSRASYLVRVAVPEAREELKRLLEEAEDVKRTLSRVIEAAKAVESDAARSTADKASATARREAAEKAQGDLDTEVKQATHVQSELDEKVERLAADHKTAFDALLDAVTQKGSSS